MSEPRARIVIFGWLGARARQLRTIEAAYRERGLETIVLLPDAFAALSRAEGFAAYGRALADDLSARHRALPLPLLVHSFSNAGFWALASWINERDAVLEAAYRGAILDSGPGFPPDTPFWFTAKYGARAMVPGLLASLGRPVAHTHPLLTPPAALFMGVWQFLARPQAAFMSDALDLVARGHRHRALTLLYGEADELVPSREVESFAVRARLAGADVSLVHFERSAHVRHFLTHRQRYGDELDRWLAKTLGAPPVTP